MLVFGIIGCSVFAGLLRDDSADALEFVCNAIGFGCVCGACNRCLIGLGGLFDVCGGAVCKKGLYFRIWQAGDNIIFVFHSVGFGGRC